MFDFFNAECRCRECGVAWAPGQGTAIQTKLPIKNRLRGYAVGDAIEIPDTAESIVNSGYFSGYAEVESLDDLWFLHHWICPTNHCQLDNAVLIHIRDGRIVETESAALDGESLRRAHFMESKVGNAVLRRVYMREYPDADEREVRVTQWDELLDDLCSGRDEDPSQQTGSPSRMATSPASLPCVSNSFDRYADLTVDDVDGTRRVHGDAGRSGELEHRGGHVDAAGGEHLNVVDEDVS